MTASWWTARPARRSTSNSCRRSEATERILLFFKPSLERIGVTVSIRTVDDRNTRTGCATGTSIWSIEIWPQSLSPGNEQREFWGSHAADMPGSRNIVGIKNPAVDKLIERVIFAKDRADLVAATKALDRVLLWNHYVRAAIHLPFQVAPPVGTASAGPTEMPKYGFRRFPGAVVVRCRQGGQGRQAILRRVARMGQPSRRQVIGLGIGAASAAWLRRRAAADDADAEVHGMSAFGDLKYPADFHHFDYVNVDAPKGGLFSTIPSVELYNQMLPDLQFAQRVHPEGRRREGMDLTFTALMSRAGDEPDAMYGLLAKSVQISADKLIYRFTLRPEARFHDGSENHRARCRILANDAESEGPSADRAADAGFREPRKQSTTRPWW